MLFVTTGQPVPAYGYYTDDHGHLLLLRAGDPAPICVYSGPLPVRWRLVRRLPEPPKT